MTQDGKKLNSVENKVLDKSGLLVRGKKLEEDVTPELLKQVVPKRFRSRITQEVVDDINLCLNDLDYSEEFKRDVLTHIGVLENKGNWGLRQYINAVKFYSLTAQGWSQVNAFCKVFPHRLEARIAAGEGKNELAGDASRYNKSELVNIIRKQSLVPFYLYNLGNRQEAFDIAMSIARHGRSEAARVNAVNTILQATEAPADNSIELQIGLSDDALAIQKAQTETMREIAKNQREMLAAGHSIEDIQSIKVTHNVIDADIDEEDEDE
jgi:hypothetical protein